MLLLVIDFISTLLVKLHYWLSCIKVRSYEPVNLLAAAAATVATAAGSSWVLFAAPFAVAVTANY